MKSVFYAIAAFLLLPALYAPGAFALSTDTGKYTNDDGTAKFSDPDDQQPGFMGGSSGGSSNSGITVHSYGFSGDSGPYLHPNGPTLEWGDSGSNAFDHAYNHQSE